MNFLTPAERALRDYVDSGGTIQVPRLILAIRAEAGNPGTGQVTGRIGPACGYCANGTEHAAHRPVTSPEEPKP